MDDVLVRLAVFVVGVVVGGAAAAWLAVREHRKKVRWMLEYANLAGQVQQLKDDMAGFPARLTAEERELYELIGS